MTTAVLYRVRSLKTYARSGTTSWAGVDNNGDPAESKEYRVFARWVAAGGQNAEQEIGPLTVARASIDPAAPTHVCWNGRGTPEKASFSVDAEPHGAPGTLTLSICSGDTPVKTFSASSGGAVTFEWDGKDNGGNLVPPGVYTVKMEWRTGHSVVTDQRWLTVIRASINRAATPAAVSWDTLTRGGVIIGTRLESGGEEGEWGLFTLRIMKADEAIRTVASDTRGPMVVPMPPMFPDDPPTWEVLNDFSDRWDGKDDAGNLVPPGLYTIHLEWTIDGATAMEECALSVLKVGLFKDNTTWTDAAKLTSPPIHLFTADVIAGIQVLGPGSQTVQAKVWSSDDAGNTATIALTETAAGSGIYRNTGADTWPHFASDHNTVFNQLAMVGEGGRLHVLPVVNGEEATACETSEKVDMAEVAAIDGTESLDAAEVYGDLTVGYHPWRGPTPLTKMDPPVLR